MDWGVELRLAATHPAGNGVVEVDSGQPVLEQLEASKLRGK